LLESQEELFVRDLGRIGAERFGVHQILRRVGESHPQAVEIRGLPDRLVGGELAHAGIPCTQRVDAGLRLEVVEQLGRRVGVHVAGEVLVVVEGVRRIQHLDRLVDRAERRRSLDVHVDVAGHDRCDAVGVLAELAVGEDLDRHAHVGLLDLVGDDLSTTCVLGLVRGVAVREPDRDGAAVTTTPIVVAACGEHEQRCHRADRERNAPSVGSSCHH
jgi:hypothetical protein